MKKRELIKKEMLDAYESMGYEEYNNRLHTWHNYLNDAIIKARQLSNNCGFNKCLDNIAKDIQEAQSIMQFNKIMGNLSYLIAIEKYFIDKEAK